MCNAVYNHCVKTVSSIKILIYLLGLTNNTISSLRNLNELENRIHDLLFKIYTQRKDFKIVLTTNDKLPTKSGVAGSATALGAVGRVFEPHLLDFPL